MIRYVEQTTANRRRVLCGLVGLYAGIQPSSDEPIIQVGKTLRDSAITFSLFDKFGREQHHLTENTGYILIFTKGRIIPQIVNSYDPVKDRLSFNAARVKDFCGEKVQVELSRLAIHLKVDGDNTVLEFPLTEEERAAEAAGDTIYNRYNRTAQVA